MPLARRLSELGYQLKISTRSQQKAQKLTSDGFDSYILDIENTDSHDAAFLDSDLLIINITSKNKTAFSHLIELVAGSAIKQVIFISATSVYQNLQRIVTEDENAENVDSVLFQIENLFRQHTGFETTIIRMAGLIGPDRHPGRFFSHGKTVQQADAPVNLIHLADCIGIICTIIDTQAWGQTYNACADSHPSKREFYSHAAKLAGMPTPEFTTDNISSAFKIVSNQKIKHSLNYQLVYPELMTIDFD